MWTGHERLIGCVLSDSLSSACTATQLSRQGELSLWCQRSLVNFCFLACVAVGLTNNDAHATTDTVSERLRRWTRNPLGSARRGSNPLGVDILFLHLLCRLSCHLTFLSGITRLAHIEKQSYK